MGSWPPSNRRPHLFYGSIDKKLMSYVPRYFGFVDAYLAEVLVRTLPAWTIAKFLLKPFREDDCYIIEFDRQFPGVIYEAKNVKKDLTAIALNKINHLNLRILPDGQAISVSIRVAGRFQSVFIPVHSIRRFIDVRNKSVINMPAGSRDASYGT